MDAVLRLIWHYYYCVLSMWGRRWGWRCCWVCVFHFGGGGSVQEVKKKKVNHFIELTYKRTKRIRMILLSEASPIFTCSPLGGRCVACVRLCVCSLVNRRKIPAHAHRTHACTQASFFLRLRKASWAVSARTGSPSVWGGCVGHTPRTQAETLIFTSDRSSVVHTGVNQHAGQSQRFFDSFCSSALLALKGFMSYSSY